MFNVGDLSNDAFNQPLYLPITDVPLLSAAGGGSDNQSFQDIDISAGTLASGSTVNLNAIGTVSTANLRYVFPNGFTVAAGATLNVGASVPVLVQTGQTLTVNGAMTLATGDTLSLSSNFDGGTQVVVNGMLTGPRWSSLLSAVASLDRVIPLASRSTPAASSPPAAAPSPSTRWP